MEFLNTFLPIILYIVAIILLVILIVLALRFIKILDRVEEVVDNLHYPVWLEVLNKKVKFGALKEMWPTTKSSVGVGEVYVDGETLKVKMSV
mgnify:CR=1 FL=1